MVDIGALIAKEFILPEFECESRENCISKMTDVLVKEGRVTDKSTYIDAVLKREALGPTGIGMQVAIPHGKSPAVNKAALMCARCRQGVDFKAADGSLANLIFLIAVPNTADDLHLRILSQLARQLMHEPYRLKLLNAKDEVEILTVLKGEGI